ncbi:hypothetical protein HPB52_006300 [Rhipicephalus sanguineus]|uniref:Myb-like domain-containing protein n=1 Tax=Rhipicephalus sanguineus TaxID=34632 RepID=A0A9D4PAS1_RHISA|nr:hypothetical protein HPB52_006300 [Rhipicephalus sanguineus]
MASTKVSPPCSASRLPTPRVRFSAADDLILVRLVAEIGPMSDPSRWQEVAQIVQDKTGKLCSARRARERFHLLLVQFRRKDNENRRKSGVEEDFGELERLLQELSDLARDCGYKPRAVDRQRKQRSTPPSAASSELPNSSTRRAKTQSLRMEAAADRLAVSTATFAAVSAAAADNHPDLGVQRHNEVTIAYLEARSRREHEINNRRLDLEERRLHQSAKEHADHIRLREAELEERKLERQALAEERRLMASERQALLEQYQVQLDMLKRLHDEVTKKKP